MSDYKVPDALVSMIQDIGYKASPDDDVIRSMMGGWNVLIFYFPNSLQFHFGLKDERENFSCQDANEFNGKYRFIKCYRRDERLHFEMDAAFNVDSSEAKGRLEAMIAMFEASIASAYAAYELARDSRVAKGE